MNRIISLINLGFLIFVTGCGPKENILSSSGTAIGNLPTGHVTALNAVFYPRQGLRFYKIDGSVLIDPTAENTIIVCTPDGEVCSSTCVSVFFPVERYSVFKTDWLQGNKCVAYALQYPNGIEVPKLKYFVGTYAGAVCAITPDVPNFDGRGMFTEIRVPEGHHTPHPQHKRLYEIQTLLDLNGNFVSSTYIYNFRPPASWDYIDTSVSPGYITPKLVGGFACVRADQIR